MRVCQEVHHMGMMNFKGIFCRNEAAILPTPHNMMNVILSGMVFLLG